MPLVTRLVGDVELNGLTLSATPGTPNKFSVGGAILTFHDFVLIPAMHMATTGTVPAASAGVAPRIVLGKGGMVSWAREVPAGWDQVSLNLLFTKEAAGSGNAHWSIAYKVVNFLTGANLDGSFTTLDLGGVSVPTNVADSKYYIPPTSQTIATPVQAFGLPPLMVCQLTRVNDGTDTYAGNIGLPAMSMSRTS